VEVASMKWKLALIFIFITALISCNEKALVQITQSKYKPSFPLSNLSEYKGVQINMVSFTNNADNTHMFYYYDPDRDIHYQCFQMLQSYLWYTFRDAFRYAGFGVYEAIPSGPNIMDFDLVMLDLTDKAFIFKIRVLKGGFLLFQKDYTVRMAPVNSYDPVILEKNAYAMIDKSVVTILQDREFLKAVKNQSLLQKEGM
jgi:hypothetical protein